jgi:amino-acid N-acetyltransferase
MTSIIVRKATLEDQSQLEKLVRGERLNPTGIQWSNFWVATSGDDLVGAAQVRPHADGSRELGSFVVLPCFRGAGVASELLDAVLAQERSALYAITARSFAGYFAPWGFAPCALVDAPRAVARGYMLGQTLGSVVSVLKGRRPRRIVVLRRDGPPKLVRAAVRPHALPLASWAGGWRRHL